MRPFEYVTAQSADSAVDLVRNGGRFIAGGNDLLGELKDDLVEVKRLVNVKALPDAGEVKIEGALCRIGTNVTVREIADHPELAKVVPGLTEAASEVGSLQIRNVATVGGNLAQHSRCWYYRHRDVHCLKNGGATCYARNGENKYHSIFSGSPCISPVVSNLSVALTALNATAIVQRGSEKVKLSMAELYHDAWVNPLAHNSLRPGDLILAVEIPVVEGQRSAYLQVSEKSDFDWALVSCSAAAKVNGKEVSDVRVALGAVAPVPFEVEEANRELEGKVVDEAGAARVADLILREAQPMEHNAYKIPLTRAVIQRTLLKLVA